MTRRVLVTGADGYIGRRVMQLLRVRGCEPVPFDLPDSVLDADAVDVAAESCDACVHLAAHKYATSAEDRPAEVTELNVQGTANVVSAFGSSVVLASTCKAADAMTVYGASKLIAERVVLNAGGVVVRFVNVVGSTGSVAQIWDRVPAGAPLPVMPCSRMWMSVVMAARLIVDGLDRPSGRYAPMVAPAEPVVELAGRLHPGRPVMLLPPRRGDRVRERLVAEEETSMPVAPGVIRISHPADRTVEEPVVFAGRNGRREAAA